MRARTRERSLLGSTVLLGGAMHGKNVILKVSKKFSKFKTVEVRVFSRDSGRGLQRRNENPRPLYVHRAEAFAIDRNPCASYC